MYNSKSTKRLSHMTNLYYYRMIYDKAQGHGEKITNGQPEIGQEPPFYLMTYY